MSVRRGLERLLRSAGYRVMTFGSAREFLDRRDRASPRCLVLDIRMPGQNAPDRRLLAPPSGRGRCRPVPYGAGKGGVIDAPGDGKIRTLVRRRAS